MPELVVQVFHRYSRSRVIITQLFCIAHDPEALAEAGMESYVELQLHRNRWFWLFSGTAGCVSGTHSYESRENWENEELGIGNLVFSTLFLQRLNRKNPLWNKLRSIEASGGYSSSLLRPP
jgi:hypothetical protein